MELQTEEKTNLSPEKGNEGKSKEQETNKPLVADTKADKKAAPFGKTVDGKPKKSPAGRKPGQKKKPETKDGTSPPAPLRPVRRTVPAGKTVDPYAELTRSVEEQKRIVERIRKDHPESRIGNPIDPRSFEQTPPHTEPLVSMEVGDAIKGVYKLFAELVEHDYMPSDEVFAEVGKKWANASRYLGTDLTPGQVAILSAAVSTGTLLLPLGISGVEKVKKTRQQRFERRLELVKEQENEASRPN